MSFALAKDHPAAHVPALAASEELATIREMAQDYGVSLRALRFYEDRGLLAPLRQGVARYYRPRERARLRLVLKGKALGFTLAEIRELLAGADGQSGEPLLERALRPDQVAAQIDHLQRQRDDLDRAIVALRATRRDMSAD